MASQFGRDIHPFRMVLHGLHPLRLILMSQRALGIAHNQQNANFLVHRVPFESGNVFSGWDFKQGVDQLDGSDPERPARDARKVECFDQIPLNCLVQRPLRQGNLEPSFLLGFLRRLDTKQRCTGSPSQSRAC